MFVLFEEAGKFLAGRILSETDASLQVELDSGKRVKVKAANALLKFEKPAPAEFMAAGQTLSTDIELDLAWEFASEDEFSFADLAREYFSADASKPASLEQQAAALFRLYDSPHYFRRAGKGRFKKAPVEILQQALLAIEKKKQLSAQIALWAEELGQGQCPAPIHDQLYKILFKPDKNSAEYKAVVDASRATRTAPLDLLQKAGAIASPYQFHWKRFLFENFPKGTTFPALQAPPIKDELPLATAQAFSIDDSSTTEIDDALSVQGLLSQGGNGTVTLGIHIAAPGLAVLPGSPIDVLGRARMSTVYMPGYKLTMLPDDVVEAYTLQEGRNCPALSLYLTLDEATLQISASVTRLEQVPIVSNLRHDTLDNTFNEAFFEAAQTTPPADVQWGLELTFLHRLAKHLKAQREIIRGKPENFTRPDYNFKLDNPSGQEPQGNEQVSISTRQRGAPLDLIVAEAMILANSTWGEWLAEHGVPGIYRSQASMAPGVKVRMGTKALPHAGIGVKSYSWATSPLRRYTDLVNQWQLIACTRHGRTAALAAPFKPKDADLFSVISQFDGAYSAYNAFQSGIERYWTLKYLQQNNITELCATTFKDNLVRADELPLVLPALGAQGLPRGARVRIKLGAINEITLDIAGTVIERLDVDVDDAVASPDDSGDETRRIWLPARSQLPSISMSPQLNPPRSRSQLNQTPACDPPSQSLFSFVKSISPLTIALSGSIILHALVLGTRFVDPERFDRMFQDTPLEVILVNAKSNEKPDKATAIAQASLAGGGELEAGRATSPLPPSALMQMGDSSEEAQRQLESMQEQQMQLLTQIKKALAAMPPPDLRPSANKPEQADREEKRKQYTKLLAEIERRIKEENARPKKRYISPATREAAYAIYFDAFRQKVEEKGTRHFPQLAGKKMYGVLIMTITINFDGQVLDTEINEASESLTLDRQAQAIVRGSGPFDRFTPAMRHLTDQVGIVARFNFTRDGNLEATLTER
ncbi:hypothetical protein AwPolaro_01010 [Polaromonas sp.]|nr:hypothetical protein AwPolaro_01010 [Polaromonas sp.]